MSPLRSLALAAVLAVSAGAAAAQPQPSHDTVGSSWTDFPVKADLADPQLRHGQEIFRARCGACHNPIPPGATLGGISPSGGTQALQAKYKGSKPAALEQRTDLTPQLVAVFVRHGTGYMPFFRPTELSDEDLAAVGAYLSRKKR